MEGPKFKDSVTRDEDLKLYVDEEPHNAGIKLDLTSNPLGFPDTALSNLYIRHEDLNHYNEPSELPELKRKIAEIEGIDEKEIMITAGADQAIEIILTHILDKEDALGILIPTFPRYEIVARRLCDARTKLFGNLSDVPEDCKAVIFCTPNNPTTEEIDIKELEAFIESNRDKFVIIDNVFGDFGQNRLSPLIKKFGNLMIIRSVSKSFGLPGIRVGWIDSQAKNVEMLRVGVSPFRVPFLSQRIVLKALNHPEHLEMTKMYLSKEFDRIKKELGDLAVRKSNVPFFLFKTKEPEKARRWLLNQGISVVDSTSFKGAEGFLRIMIGKKEENDIVINKLKAFVKENLL